jgi:REP element-mobilizing transposase RayT
LDKFKNKYRIASHRKPDWDYSANALYFLTLVTQNRECNLAEIVNYGDHVHSKLSSFGEIVEQEWFKSFDIRKELIPHEFIIMPNHLHGIVEISRDTRPCVSIANQINDNVGDTRQCVSTANQINDNVGDARPCVSTANQINDNVGDARPCVSTANQINDNVGDTRPCVSIANQINDNVGDTRPCVSTLPIKRNPAIRLPKSISSFIAGFKSAVNTKINDFIDQQKLSISKYNRNNHFFQPNYHDHIIRNQLEYQNITNYIRNNPAKWIEDKFYKSNPSS